MPRDTVQFKKFTWYNFTSGSEKDLLELQREFNFSASQINDCATPPLRPKIEFSGEYIFLVLLFPIFNRKTKHIHVTEVDIFTNSDYLVTYHQGQVNALKDALQKFRTIPHERAVYANASPLGLLLHLLEQMVLAYYPMLNHISWDIDNVDSQLFNEKERELIRHVLIIKKNIVDIRKTTQSLERVLRIFAERYVEYYKSTKAYDVIFNSLVTHTHDIVEHLENHKKTIDAVQETNESLITFRLNDIMKTLTIFSVIVFPLTLLASIFGMNAIDGMPFLDSRYGFWKVIMIMAVGSIVMFTWFKRHRWL